MSGKNTNYCDVYQKLYKQQGQVCGKYFIEGKEH